MAEEKRKFIRVKTRKSVANCRLLANERSGESKFAVWPVKDLGIGGAAVYCEDDIPLETLAYLNMDLDVIRRTIGVIAKVIWRQAKDAGYELGLRFCWWPLTDDRDVMADYIENKITYNDTSEEVLLG
ncbi:MAG: PilZ domain-containing protein [Candidatus Omnitrophota bacterium]